jgi:hypothetical protein
MVTGNRFGDIFEQGMQRASCSEMGDAVVCAL